MSVLFNGAVSGSSSVDTGDIGHSLRFRSGSYLTRTPGSSGSRRKLTVSMWVKRCALGVFQRTFGADDIGSTTFCVGFNTNNKLEIRDFSGGYLIQGISTQVFRDTTSFIHLVVAFDTDQATFANGVKAYVNGTQITAWDTSTYSGVHDLQINDTRKQSFGVYLVSGSPSAPFDYGLDYLARACIVTGSQEAPTSFAYLNTEINEWVSKSQSAVKAVVDAGGTNSFMLDFDNGSSLTTLGYDKSSKGNNWTLNNFSLTAGTTYDHMLDVPGNSFATANPLDKGNVTIADGNLKVTHTTYQDWWRGSVGVSSGKWAWEVTATSSSSGSPYEIGVAKSTGVLTTDPLAQSAVYAYYGSSGNKYNGSSAAYGATYTAGDVIRVELDLDAGTLVFFKNGTSQGTAYTGLSGTFFAMTGCGSGGVTQVTNLNFGQAPLHASATYHSAAGGYFRDAPTTGFKALCQRNLPDPAILNPSSAVAHRFEAGSGIAAAIATDRSGWADWMEWFKRTDTTESWKVRFSNDSGNMMAFDTNGAKAAWSAPSTGTYLGAAFKLGAANGCVSGTYSGDSTSNKNISHSLGKAPTAALVKNESTGSWYVWHTKMTSAAYFTTLNSATPPAQSNTNTPWGTGNWSSTQFMVTNNATNNLNATGSTYRYILFADIDGLLALLGHTGNASTDGAFESSGHKSQLLIQKDLSATTGFYVWSDKIDTYNVTASYLLLNTNAGTAAATGVDVCSNGTKYRSATIANATNPHMGISYSRTPGKYSLGR